MKESRKNKHFPPSQFSDLFVLPRLLTQYKRGFFWLFFFFFLDFIFANFDAIASSSKVNFHIPHGCDLWSNEREQNRNVKIGCVRCQER